MGKFCKNMLRIPIRAANGTANRNLVEEVHPALDIISQVVLYVLDALQINKYPRRLQS